MDEIKIGGKEKGFTKEQHQHRPLYRPLLVVDTLVCLHATSAKQLQNVDKKVDSLHPLQQAAVLHLPCVTVSAAVLLPGMTATDEVQPPSNLQAAYSETK